MEGEMSVRAFFGVLMALLLAGLLIGIGTAIYNEGVAAGLATAQRAADRDGGQVIVAPGLNGIGAGFGVGDLVGIAVASLLFVIGIGLAGILLRGGPRHGHRPGSGGWSDRREQIEEWHRELHRRDGEGGTTPAGA